MMSPGAAATSAIAIATKGTQGLTRNSRITSVIMRIDAPIAAARAAYVPYFTRARPDSQDHAPPLAPGPAAATIRSATTASAITAPRAMKSGDRGMGPDYPSVDANA